MRDGPDEYRASIFLYEMEKKKTEYTLALIT